MRWIRCTRGSWAWTWTICWCRSRTTAAGAGNRGSADPVERGGHYRGGLGGGTGAAGGIGRRYGRRADGVAGAADVAGSAEADGDRIEVEDLPDIHQPDSRKDRGNVRQSRDDYRRTGAEVLLFDSRGYPAHTVNQRRGSRGGFAH